MDDSTANSMSSSQELDMSSNGDSYQGLPSSLVEAEERRRKSSESSMSGGNAPERGATTPSAMGSPRSGDITSSGGGMLPPPSSPVSRGDQLHKRIESLVQQNRVLKCELETYKCRVKSLQEENRNLRQASVHIQAKAEQEEEFISNTLLKKIQALKKEKENLALNYEQEEECLTNDLSRKLDQLRQEKVQLEHTLEQEQECLVNKLMRRIEKLETETTSKQTSLETLRREKVELENTLEQEQEALVNKLWKRMDQLETEKRSLQVKLDKPISEPDSPRSLNDFNYGSGDTAANLANNIRALKQECVRLKHQLISGKQEHEKKMAAYAKEEKEIREENLRLQRRLQLEMERREALCRHLSESESSLEMEEERVYNEMSSFHNIAGGSATGSLAAAAHANSVHRTRTVSSPVPVNMGNIIGGPGAAIGGTSVPVINAGPAVVGIPRPLSPGLNYGERRPVDAIGLPPIAGRIPLTTPPGVPSPSPPPSVIGSVVQTGPARAAAFVRPGFAHQNSATMFSGQMVSPPHPNTAGNVTSSTSSSASASLYDKPPASPMDTSDNNISSHSISSSVVGCTGRNTSVVNIIHTSTPNKSPGSSGGILANTRSPASQQHQPNTSKSTLNVSQQQQNNVNKNIVSETKDKNSDGGNVTSTSTNSTSS